MYNSTRPAKPIWPSKSKSKSWISATKTTKKKSMTRISLSEEVVVVSFSVEEELGIAANWDLI